MKTLRLGIAIALAVGMGAATLAALARAGVDVTAEGAHGVRSGHVWSPNRDDGRAGKVWQRLLSPDPKSGDDYLNVAEVGRDGKHYAASAGYDFASNTAYAGARTADAGARTADAGARTADAGARTADPVDQSTGEPDGPPRSASVGLYSLLESTDAPPSDSLMGVQILRNLATHHLMLTVRGGLRTQVAPPGDIPSATFRVLVFADRASAESDNQELGSLFFAEVTLQNKITTKGGFSSGDFTLQTDGKGQFTARPLSSLIKIVNVPDASSAVVRVVADPTINAATRTATASVPGVTPFGLWVVALALLASGAWALRGARREPV